MDFLPSDYEAPKMSNNYMKLQDGENRIRILSRPIIGWEDWDNKKPIRFTMDKKPAKSIDPLKPIKHFWAFIIWNYNDEQIQIMELTQATIRKSLEALCKDADWGAPFGYDIKIMKQGEGVKTEYSLNPVPHKTLAPSIAKAFAEKPCYLEALFIGGDPFSREWSEFTPLANQTADKVELLENLTTEEDAQILEKMLAHVPKHRERVFQFLREHQGTESLVGIKRELYNNIRYKTIQEIEDKNEKTA